MGIVKSAIIGMAVILAASYFINRPEREIPKLPNTWWGRGPAKEEDKNIKPFKITFTKELVDDLKVRLNKTRTLQPALEDSQWTYGVDGAYLPIVIDYWLNKYDFKKREQFLNQYPQFTTNIQGLNIHFLHVKPKNHKGKRVLPLLIQHGWPGSVVEFYKILPLLTTPREEQDFVFEVIAPSLPGFGFSSSAVRPGLGSPQMAVVLKNLMLRLGFEQFYTQGGDWGAVILANMASLFPEHVLGLHSNMCIVLSPWNMLKMILYSYFPSLLLSAEDYHRMYPLSTRFLRNLEETGYFHIQSTKPDTVGVGLSDSPAGLAAYILEKFSTGTNPNNRFHDDGNLLKSFTFDQLLDNLMVYWTSNSITTSMRIYAETINKNYLKDELNTIPITVPSACAQFPHEISYQPPSLIKHRYKNLIRATKMPRGGHFAAMEQPQLLADDIWTSIAEMEILRKKEVKN
ncbi:juvenile hormone epoxide hydrolase 2 [Cephus cinctus]|uniref:Epoxide hydrolase n=1 Tax=Cephus cinctus TaxID=211228 RepID=A0AAJ7C219_CEPCN|nr:juvenile hormone epoxide hydrolase 2 [Cephus cinctus]